ncbi:MAG: hypothetical protein ACLT46_09785 [Hungatella sp.]
MKPEEPQKGSLGMYYGGSGSGRKMNGWRYTMQTELWKPDMVSGTNQEQVAWQMIDGKMVDIWSRRLSEG